MVFPEFRGGLVWGISGGLVERLNFDQLHAVLGEFGQHVLQQDRAHSPPGVCDIHGDPQNLGRLRGPPLDNHESEY
jgi:hypothetical protein